MAAPMEDVCAELLPALLQLYMAKQGRKLDLTCLTSAFESNHILSMQQQSGVSLQEMVSYVHSCLGSSKQRGEGLLLLDVLVRQSRTDIFQKNALTWIKLLMNIMQGHSTGSVYKACCQIMGQIIQFSKTFSDLTREITTSVVPQLLPILLSSPLEASDSAVSCINKVLKAYPGPAGPFKHKLETMVLQHLDDNISSLSVVQCYALLAQCGPGGTAGIKHTDAWSQQCAQLLGSLEASLCQLYEGIELDQQPSKGRQLLNLSLLAVDRPDAVTALVKRWTTLTGCMVALLSEDMQAVMKVPAQQILQLVCRCLAVNTPTVLQKPTTERSLLAAYVPELHVSALNILDKLILLCRKNLVPQCTVIVGVLSQELVWSQTPNTGYNKQYCMLREKVYEVLVTWMKVCDGCSGIVLEEKTLLQHLLQDCAPFSSTLQLAREATKAGEPGSKKKKKHGAGYQEINQQGISSQRKVHQDANSGLVQSALKALYWLVSTSGSEMTGKKLQEIQRFVVQTLLLVQQTPEVPIPYTCAGCRQGLYRVLQACVLTPHPIAPPPIQCSLQILSAGVLDMSTEVSSLCMEALRTTEALIHPRVPCLNGPVICENVIHIGGPWNLTTANGESYLNGNQRSTLSESEAGLSNESGTSGSDKFYMDKRKRQADKNSDDSTQLIKQRKLHQNTEDHSNGLDSENNDDIQDTECNQEEQFTAVKLKVKPRQETVDVSEDIVNDDLNKDDVNEGDSEQDEHEADPDDLEEDNTEVEELGESSTAVRASTSHDTGTGVVRTQLSEERVVKMEVGSTADTATNLHKETEVVNISDEESEEGVLAETSATANIEEPNEEVETMLTTFVDAGPDSD